MTSLLLATAITGFLVSLLLGFGAPKAWLATVLIGASAALGSGVLILGSGDVWSLRTATRVGGEAIHLRLDALSALFLALLSMIGSLGAWYGREYWNDRAHPRSAGTGRIAWSVLVACLGLVLVAANGLHFLMAWELFTLAAYVLVTLNRPSRVVREAGWLYLGASHVAALALFAFFTKLAAQTGSWDLGPMRERAELAPLFWLVLAGFGLKAGMFPLHVWLPSAHANAPTHVSAMLSGMTLKIGIYGLVRFTGWLPVPESAGWLITGLGLVSAVLGVALALGQHDLKRLLAYHSVENIGIILIGLGFALVAVAQGHANWGRLALAGGLLHVWNHGLFKSLLFFAAGSVLHATGTREMSQLGGLWRRMPWTASLFALGAAAISGLPPLNGFISEWLVYLGLLEASIHHQGSAWGAVLAAILLAVTGALALACFAKVCGVVFLGAPRSARTAQAHEGGVAMRGPMVLLGLTCTAIGLAPWVVWPAVIRAVEAWNPHWTGTEPPAGLAAIGKAHGALFILALALAVGLWRRVQRGAMSTGPTWDCGYAHPTPRMQYTAGSFAGIINGWFAWILRPVRHERRPMEPFPIGAHASEHTPETVLDYVVQPAARLVMTLSRTVRRLQHGRVQAYLLYLLVGLGGITALVLIGKDS